MKDRTNKVKPALSATIDGIGMMYRALAALQTEVYPQSPAWFAVMAQGSIDQIRDLLDDLEWLMEDMVPRELREHDQAAAQPEALTQKEAA